MKAVPREEFGEVECRNSGRCVGEDGNRGVGIVGRWRSGTGNGGSAFEFGGI